jgi:hypothetical protein
MAALTADGPTIIDVEKSKDPKGNALRAANLMAQTIVLDRMLNYVPCNGGLYHRVGQIVTEPGTTIRARNEGVVATKEERVQHDEGFCDFHQWGKVDAGIAEDMGNVNMERAKRVRSGFAAIARKKEYTTFYGSKAGSAGKEFDGLGVRFAAIGQQVIDCGGTATLASLWVFRASPETIYFIYPENGTKGMRHRAWPMQVEPNQGGVTGANMACWKDEMWQECGIAVEDPRCVVRLSNINTAHFTDLTSTQAPTSYTSVVHKIMVAHDRLPNDVTGRDFGVTNRTVYGGLRRLAMEKSMAAIGLGQAQTVIGPREAIIVDGLPIFSSDALTNAETQLT